MAVQVEDHDLAFGDFEGEIPEGHYGAGRIRIWDNGSYEVDLWGDRKIAFTLHGKRATGKYNLVRLAKGRAGDWLFIKLAAAA